MKKHLLFFTLTLCTVLTASAQDTVKTNVAKSPWKRTIGLGLDAGQLSLINPRVGAGESRINLGGAANAIFNYKKGRYSWENSAAALFAVQKLGSGIAPLPGSNTNYSRPFQKSTDEFRVNSKFGFSLKEAGKVYIALDAALLTQLTPTFGLKDGNNYLTDIRKLGINDVKAKFFSPAIASVAVGIDYKPMPKLSFFYSPLTLRAVIVQNDNISSRPASTGSLTNAFGVDIAKNANYNLGSSLRGMYSDKFFKDKLIFTSNLGLFGAYAKDKGIKVDWANQLSWQLFKGLQLGFNVNLLYDKEILVQVSDKNGVNGVKVDPLTLKPVLVNSKPSIIQQLLLKYATTF
ncbi:MAG: DUF3078 domain-containing protein [Saprospiraceae bacterium]